MAGCIREMLDGPDGDIFVVDRKKDMIITSGYNIYPAEIERVVLKALVKAAMCAVGKEPDERRGELAKAFVVLKPGKRRQKRKFCPCAATIWPTRRSERRLCGRICSRRARARLCAEN